jgi:hypothetical protein
VGYFSVPLFCDQSAANARQHSRLGYWGPPLRVGFSFQIYRIIGGTMLQAWKVAGSGPDEVDISNLPNPSSRTMVLGSTQSLTEMSTRNLPGG